MLKKLSLNLKKLTVKDVLAHKKMIEDVQISDDFKEKQKLVHL